jgi:hypothetical protein
MSERKTPERQVPADWPMNPDGTPVTARPVPLEDLSREELLYVYRLHTSKEYIDATERLLDNIARGLYPGASLPSQEPIGTLGYRLTPRQRGLLNWLYARPGMMATFEDVARFRMQKQRGNPKPPQIETAGKDLRRLRQKLDHIKSHVRIDMLTGKRVRLIILPCTPGTEQSG